MAFTFPPEVLLRSAIRSRPILTNCLQSRSTSSAQTYKAAVCVDLKKPLETQERKLPENLGKGQVLVEVGACGINFSDILMCKGEYQVKPPLPFIAGSEICGLVEDIGEGVSNINKGDKVIGFVSNSGGFSQYCTIPSSQLLKIPQHIPTSQGAATLISYGTAMMALGRRAQLQKGETVLVTAAAGATGLAAVDIATNIFGTKVIGVCGGEDKCRLVKQRGAVHAIDYNKEDVRSRVKEITNGAGVNVVMDQVGGDLFLQCIKSIAQEGRILTVGYASGKIPTIPANLLLLKSCSVMGVYWGSYSQTNPQAFYKSIMDVMNGITAGKLNPHVGATFSLSKINEAFQYVADRKSTGKVVINVQEV